MPSIASLEDLKLVRDDLAVLKENHPEIYAQFQDIFKRWRKVGYKNISKLLLGESTPEKLKGMTE